MAKTRVLTLKELIEQEDPLANITKGDALKYATKMGASDSLRGLAQIGSGLFGFEEATEKLKKQDQKLQRILDHEEWGGAAIGVFLTSAIAADPIGYLPIIGWAKKAKTIKDMTKYGAMAGGIHSGMSYVSEEEPGLIGEKQSRLENAALGVGLGSTIGWLGAKGVNAIAAKLGKEKPFPTKVVETPKTDVIRDDFVGPLTPIQAEHRAIRDRVRYQEADEFVGPRVIETDEQKLQRGLIEEYGGKTKMSAGLQKFYEDHVGKRFRDLVFNNWGSSLSGVAGGVVGYNAFDDPDATYKQKWAAFAAGMALGIGGAKGLGKIKFQNEAFSEHMSRLLVDDYGLQPEYLKLRGDIAINKNSIGQEFKDITTEIFNNLNKNERRFLYAFMTGDLDSIPKGAVLGDKARKTVTKYAQEMVDLDLLSPKVFKANRDTYLHRTYTKHLNNKTVGRGEIKTARKLSFMGDELKGRGINKTNISEKKWNEIYKIENETLDPKAQWKIVQGKEGKGKLNIRRDFTKAERLEMGEIEDASYALAETGRLMAHDISMAKFLRALATDSKFSKSAKEWKAMGSPANWVRVPKSKIYKTQQKAFGKELSGRYVPKEIMQDLRRTVTVEPDNVVFQELKDKSNSLMRLWKKSKTAWNPTVHMNNMMSNMILLDFADAPHTLLPRALKELRNKEGELYKVASKYGVFDVDIVTRELREMGGEIEKGLLKFTNEQRPSEIFNYAEGWYKTALRKGYAKTLGKLEDVYQAEDQLFRMAVFMDRLGKGKGIREAAMDSKRWFINYDINAPAINLAKKTVTPFISYTYRVVPLLAETATMKPWKVVKWASLGYALNYIGNEVIGSEEAERASIKKEQSTRLWGLPFTPPTTLKLPFLSEAGESQYLDVTRWVPGGDVFESKEGVPQPIQPGGLYVDLAKILLTQQDPFTGREIEGMGEGEDVKAIIKAVVKSWTPNNPLVPTSYSQDKIVRALRKKGYFGLDKESIIGDAPYSAPPSLTEALLSSVGVKLRPQDVDRNLSLRAIEYNKLLGNIKKTLRKAGQDLSFGKISEKEYNKILIKQEEKIIEAARDYQLLEDSVLDAEKKEELERRKKKITGGLIEGEGEVPYVKEKPEERVNPFTGEPYTALYYRGGAVRKQYAEGESDDKKVSQDVEDLDIVKEEAIEANNAGNIVAEEEHRTMDNATIPQESIAFNEQEDSQALKANGITTDMGRLGFTKVEEEAPTAETVEVAEEETPAEKTVEAVITEADRYNNVKESKEYGNSYYSDKIVESMFSHTGDETLKELEFGTPSKLDKRDNTSYPEIKIEFVNTVYNAARNLGYSSDYSLLIAGQAAKESAYGAKAGGNIFGMKFSKAAKEAGYKPITITTHEIIDGVSEKSDRVFVDLTGHSIKDNIKFYNSFLIEERFPDVRKFADQGKLKEAVQSLKHVDEGGLRTGYFVDAEEGTKNPDQYATDLYYVQGLLATIDGARRRIGL